MVPGPAVTLPAENLTAGHIMSVVDFTDTRGNRVHGELRQLSATADEIFLYILPIDDEGVETAAGGIVEHQVLFDTSVKVTP